MTSKWQKMPNGRRLRQAPDRLALWLADCEPLIPALIAPSGDYSTDASAPQSQAFQGYHTEDFDPRKLRGKEITILGAGSVAGYVSHFLGLAELVQHVVDFKKVDSRHTQGGRTIYEATQIGLWKVHALKQKVERDYPGTTVHPYPLNVAEIPDGELRNLFVRSLVVIVAIDDPVEMLRAADLAYPMVELIQVGMHRKALSGHIAISIPIVTPCLRCTLGINSAQEIHRLDGERGSSLDIINVAHQAASIAVDIMYSKVTGQNITRWDPTKNLIFIANARQESGPDRPGLHFDGSRKRPGCPICDRQ